MDKIIPVNGHLYVKMNMPDNKTEGGVILPDGKASTKYYEPTATILAKASDEASVRFIGNVGDKIIFRGGQTVQRGKEILTFVRIVDVIAVIS